MHECQYMNDDYHNCLATPSTPHVLLTAHLRLSGRFVAGLSGSPDKAHSWKQVSGSFFRIYTNNGRQYCNRSESNSRPHLLSNMPSSLNPDVLIASLSAHFTLSLSLAHPGGDFFLLRICLSLFFASSFSCPSLPFSSRLWLYPWRSMVPLRHLWAVVT
jgi:hypothetical protein